PAKEPNHQSYAKLIPPEKLKEDLDFLFKTIEEVHPNMYAYTPKEEFSPLRDELYCQINRPMTRLEFYKLVAPVVASLKSGHTHIQPFPQELKEYKEKGGYVFPLGLRLEMPRVIISRNYSSIELPLGATLLKVNGRPAFEIFQKFARLIPAENKNSNPAIIERPEILGWLLYLEYGPVKLWDVEIKTADGAVHNYSIKSVSLVKIEATPSKANSEKERNRYKYIPRCNAALLEINSFGGDPRKFKGFLKRSFQKIQTQKITHLIIDIRENPGGSDMNADALLEHLTAKPYKQFEEARIKLSSQDEKSVAPLRQQQPQLFRNKKLGDIITLKLPAKKPSYNPLRFTGQTYILIGPRSFSTSTSFAATIKRFEIGKLIGEETGDPLIVYGHTINVQLPNSRLPAVIPGRAFVLPGGKADGRGVLPDYEAKQKLEDTAKAVDTVLQFTLDLIKKSDSKIPVTKKNNNTMQN
ncbi:unnamed protein product, partial [marine sediment metagenome]